MLRKQLRPAIVLTLVLCVITGVVYPGVVTGARAAAVSAAGERLARRRVERPRRRQRAHRAVVHAAGVLPSASVGGGRGLRRHASSGGTNKGPTDASSPTRSSRSAVDSAVAQDGAVKGQIPSDMVTSSALGTRSAHLAGERELQVARVARARAPMRRAVRALVACAYRRTPVRLPRRAARERARAQHRARLGCTQ